MPGSVRHAKPDVDDRRVIYLELVAASAILFIIILMTYLMLTFPAT